MVETTNPNIGSSLQTPQALHTRSSTVNASADSGKKPSMAAARVQKPEVGITEVASKVESEKQDSVASLTQLTSELREAISALNAALEKTPTKAIITRDEDLNRFIVKIADQTSGEVVREIPSEALLKFARNLQELKGLIFDESL